MWFKVNNTWNQQYKQYLLLIFMYSKKQLWEGLLVQFSASFCLEVQFSGSYEHRSLSTQFI